MDSSLSEPEEGTGRLSLSLVSYGSDIEEADSSITAAVNQSSDTLVPHAVGDVTVGLSSTPISSSSEEEEMIASVASQLGLSGVSHEKLEQLSFAMEKMRASQQKYIRLKTIWDAVVTVAKKPNRLPTQTAQKVNAALDHIGLLDYVVPNEVNSCDGVFGISEKHLEELIPIDLTALDIQHLREAVEEEICLDHQRLLSANKRYSDIMSKVSGPVACNTSNSAEQKNTHELLSLRQELDREICVNGTYLEELDNVSSNLLKVKIDSFKRINSNRVDAFQRRCEILKTHIRSLNDQIVNGIYLEDGHLVDAFTELRKNVDMLVTEAKSELSALQKKNDDYEKLQGTHFDKILAEYQDLMQKISEKEYTLKNISKR
ncbi:uncharacterized protein LOC117650449 [Thrips palmi]|uniref:Uncharacterized protein LOC117650449 n=1 Tax=Thrips palmi TaxID=161013 RepID=A0A6P8ZWL9_THRPL|nr:uncharacterized protein LOC117650449 [Thrips palmi]XP_034249788.1 uncharacterized protein LOC117650449 [Thrips palmi]